jgi:DNA-directed RNA polymerase subunit M/transcription elongation factor TFIIS
VDYCPYCGEDLPPKAMQCPKCGVIIEADTGELEKVAVAPDAESRKATAGASSGRAASSPLGDPAKKKTEPCPRCEKPVKASAHRCPHCGHAIRDIVDKADRDREASFQRNVKLGVAGGAAGLFVLVVLIGLLRGGGEPVKRGQIDKIGFDDLAAMVAPASKRAEENWTRYRGKWVSWEGRVVDVEKPGLFGSKGALLVREARGAGDADVRVEVGKSELAKPHVGIGALVNFSGRLEAHGGDTTFTIADGQVHSAKE